MFTAEKVAEQLPPVHNDFDRYLRDYNDTTTWFAEALNGSMRTPFEYSFDGRELHADDGSALKPIFEDAVNHAEQIATNEPILSFEKRRRQHELQEYSDMLAMAKGELPNTMVVVSDFPEELRAVKQDVGGYNIKRQQTMLRVIYWQDGRMHMLSQSLDGSNRQALEEIYAQFGVSAKEGELLGQRIHTSLSSDNQEYLIDKLTGVYDRKLSEQFGGEWHAGRRERKLDTYSFAQSQHDLVDRYVMSLQRGLLSDSEKYNIMAALDARYESAKNPAQELRSVAAVQPGSLAVAALRPQMSLDFELRTMGRLARAEGKAFSGCGGTVKANNLGAENQLDDLGYGNKAESGDDDGGDGLGPLTFKCTEGHTNTRKKGELLRECRIKGCKKGSVGCG